MISIDPISYQMDARLKSVQGFDYNDLTNNKHPVVKKELKSDEELRNSDIFDAQLKSFLNQ